MIVIGLTGGIASGKSSITQALAARGAAVIDADKVGNDVYRPDTDGWRQVVETFGNGVLTPAGEIDRKALGAIVFADPAELGKLERIVWPQIHGAIARQLDELRGNGACAV